ncbi:retrovirus-related pol polyprotein from transposon TNT 1-94, partial [Tanacetum coccineum]
MMMERARADRFWRRMSFMESELRQIRRTMTITRSGMTPKAIEEVVNRQVEEALAAYKATRAANTLEAESQSQNGNDDKNGNSGNGNGNGGDGNGGNGNGGNGNPNENNRGARLLSSRVMETVFHISNCLEKYQVKYATCTLLNSALTWWNSHKRTIRVDAAFSINDLAAYTQRFQELTMLCTKMVPKEEVRVVEKFIGGLPDNIQGNVIAAEPTRLQDAVRIANNLMDQKLKEYAVKNAKNKRRLEGHYRNECPKLKNQNRGNKAGKKTEEARGKAYVLGVGEANPDSNVVTGMFLLNNHYASMLFNSGAGQSFVSTTFSTLLDITPDTLDISYAVELADRRISETNIVLSGCTLGLLGHPFNIDLILVELGSFDVIIGMDWLANHHAVIVYDEKIMQIPYADEENGVTRPKKYSELSATEAPQANYDITATNIILQGLPPEVYALVSNHKVAKELWERIQLLMQGTSLTKQERECKLYDEFDMFAYKKEETLRDFYLRFSLLLNDMNIYNMKLEQFQVNTKFLNTLPPEWSKFMTYVKLVWDLHTTNIDQLHAYLGQHEFHANKVRLMHERNSDLLALVATHQMTQSPYQTHQNSYQNTQFQPQVSPYQSQQYSTHQSSTPFSITYPSNDYQSSIHHNVYSPSSSIPQLKYVPTVNQQLAFSQPNSDLIILVFQKGDDPIDAINHMMSFLTAVVTSRYPTTNNQVRNSLNPRQQATINNGRVTLQPIQGRQTSLAVGPTRTYTSGASGSNFRKQRTVICYNCKGGGHMSEQCTKPKRKQDDSWFKDKVLLVQAQVSGQILYEEELAFLADLGILEGQATQTVITHNAAY